MEAEPVCEITVTVVLIGGEGTSWRLCVLQQFCPFSAICSFEAPLASMLTERRRTVRKQYEALQQRRALQDTTNHCDNTTLKDTPGPQPNSLTSIFVVPGRVCPTLHLDYNQKLQLQQQIQQVLCCPSVWHHLPFISDQIFFISTGMKITRISAKFTSWNQSRWPMWIV